MALSTSRAAISPDGDMAILFAKLMTRGFWGSYGFIIMTKTYSRWQFRKYWTTTWF